MELSAIRIKELLEENRMTQQDLADKSGVSKSYISKYINGKYCPKADAAQKMADVFNVSPVWLMGIEGVDRNNESVDLKSQYSNSEIEKAIKLYEQYKNAIPQVQSAVEALLKPSQSEP